MRLPRIYSQHPLTTGNVIILDDKATHHLINVLRFKVGYRLNLFDGNGHEFSCSIQAITKRSVEILIGEAVPAVVESSLIIHLGQGISRSQKMDVVLQKAVELGAQQITPLITEFCHFNLDDKRLQKRMEHWQTIIINACEQSGRAQLPKLHEPCSLIDWLNKSAADLKLVLDPSGNQTIAALTQHPAAVNLLIGPEGGLSDVEINLATSSDYKKILLGPRILRTETATLAAIALLQGKWGDMRL